MAVVITHAWRENKQPKRQTISLERPGPYAVVTAAEPVDESIELALPSDVPKGP